MADSTAPPAPPEEAKLTLHHLNDSQSQRILWLLEELQTPYNLVLHTRTKEIRAPPALTSIHPLGRAPILITPSGRTLTESLTIATYLLETYDPTKKFSSSDTLQDLTLVSFGASSLADLASTELLFDIAAKRTPWPLVYVTRKIKGSYDRFFSAKEFKKDMEFLTGELGGREWFSGGGEPGRADFMLSWPMDMCAERGFVDFERDWKELHKWRMRVREREGWKRGIEKGNGYDLTAW